MKILQGLLVLVILMFGIQNLSCQETEIGRITKAIKSADTKAIHEFCENSITLSLPGTNGKFSKTQACKILDQFFSSHPVKEVRQVKLDSNVANEFFSIIEYKSKDKSYNFLIQVIRQDQQYLIKKIQIQEIITK